MAYMQETPVLVYDVGGSHVSAAVCQGGNLQLGPQTRACYPAEQSCSAFIRFLHDLGTQAATGFTPPTGATLAFPGPFDFAVGISLMHHKLPYLYGVNLRLALAKAFGWEPCQVGFLNDAGAHLLGEVGAGAAQGATRAVGVTLGTGTGSAFAVDGRLVVHGKGVPPNGEIWNLPFEDGIVEDFLSSRAVIAGYRRRTGVESDVKTIAAAAAHDQAAADIFNEFGRHLGQVIAAKLTEFAPEVIVLGGGISRAAELFLPAAESELGSASPKLRLSALQDSAPLVGCAVARFNR